VKIRTILLAAALAGVSAPALAQDDSKPKPPQGDTFTVGIGGGVTPSYEGSDDYVLFPAGIVRGRVSGMSFATRGTTLAVDVIPDRPDQKVAFQLGPAANVRLDRSGAIRDPQVKLLGKVKKAFEVGGFAGIGFNQLLDPYDTLSFRTQVLTDVSGVHRGTIVTPSVEYGTPLSRRLYVGLSASADHVDGNYARTYFAVDAAGAARSGLRPYSLNGGWKNMRFSLLANQTLSGDLTGRNLSLFAVGSYSRLLGAFARSPLVRDVGARDQFTAIVGLAYTF
jgi:outer membrane scaffolding protein for murein synthesis (MipA/OmpV family)